MQFYRLLKILKVCKQFLIINIIGIYYLFSDRENYVYIFTNNISRALHVSMHVMTSEIYRIYKAQKFGGDSSNTFQRT